MNLQQLAAAIQKKKSVLCVGLDTDIHKIPPHLLQVDNPILAFNKAIIDATQHVAVAYKINTAFYEAMGVQGWEIMEATRAYIPQDCFTIADAKRGDIGNTSYQYAKTFFETYPYDSVTVAPYMGSDSVKPFLQYDGKFAIVLAITSNDSSKEFQLLPVGSSMLFEEVLRSVSEYGSPDNTMFVVGATRTEQLQQVRAIVPHHFLLIPGVGAQGGDLLSIMKTAMNDHYGILVNVSRGIIYADDSLDFEEKVKKAAEHYQKQMATFIS